MIWASNILFTILFSGLLTKGLAGNDGEDEHALHCFDYRFGWRQCGQGCCGPYGEQYCCFYWRVYAIIGGIIGGLVFIGAIAGVVVIYVCKCKTTEANTPAPPMNGQHVSIIGPPAYTSFPQNNVSYLPATGTSSSSTKVSTQPAAYTPTITTLSVIAQYEQPPPLYLTIGSHAKQPYEQVYDEELQQLQ